jgi:hypothetical protein
LVMSEPVNSPVELLPKFSISDKGRISSAFLDRHVRSFRAAARYVQRLPYRRNSNKADLTTVLSEGCGTCGAKHALLKLLADEHGVEELDLTFGVFRMRGANTGGRVSATLKRNGLDYLPEVHCYLKYKGRIIDLTWDTVKEPLFLPDLIEELIVLPEQIGHFKVAYHKQFLRRWLTENPQLAFTEDAIWQIREQCIADLANTDTSLLS